MKGEKSSYACDKINERISPPGGGLRLQWPLRGPGGDLRPQWPLRGMPFGHRACPSGMSFGHARRTFPRDRQTDRQTDKRTKLDKYRINSWVRGSGFC